jgi:hypothetical protein
MFYFGYLGWEWPTSRLLQRLPLGKYSAFNVVMWGTVLALHATVWSFGSAVAARLFLGVFEAAVTPGFALLTSQCEHALSFPTGPDMSNGRSQGTRFVNKELEQGKHAELSYVTAVPC